MKTKSILLVSFVFGFVFISALAQPGGPRGAMSGPPTGPQFGGYMAKIFGENPNFTADMEFHVSGGDTGDMTMPGKFACSDGKTRFEMDMTQIKGARQMTPQAIASMKRMGMDKTVSISRPDKKVTYIVMSGMKAYMENPMQDPEASKPASDYKQDITKIGEETIDGHPCIKNKVVSTDSNGKTHEATVWNATDLGKFPLKVQSDEDGKTFVMVFKDVKTGKPDASLFEPPADFKKYNSYMELMMSQMQNFQH